MPLEFNPCVLGCPKRMGSEGGVLSTPGHSERGQFLRSDQRRVVKGTAADGARLSRLCPFEARHLRASLWGSESYVQTCTLTYRIH